MNEYAEKKVITIAQYYLISQADYFHFTYIIRSILYYMIAVGTITAISHILSRSILYYMIAVGTITA